MKRHVFDVQVSETDQYVIMHIYLAGFHQAILAIVGARWSLMET